MLMKDNPIHFRKASIREMPRSRTGMSRVYGNVGWRDRVMNDEVVKLDKGRDKCSRLFFF